MSYKLNDFCEEAARLAGYATHEGIWKAGRIPTRGRLAGLLRWLGFNPTTEFTIEREVWPDQPLDPSWRLTYGTGLDFTSLRYLDSAEAAAVVDTLNNGVDLLQQTRERAVERKQRAIAAARALTMGTAGALSAPESTGDLTVLH